MNKVANYFDERADSWLGMEQHTKSPVQAAVAIMAGVGAGSRVLDLGCGLGVMVPIYRQLGAARVVGVDVSEKMVELARKRWAGEANYEFVAADAAALDTDDRFGAVVIYNAYPHFMDRPALVKTCHRLLCEDGRFVVAHGTGKDEINSHHQAVAAGVSLGLKPASREAHAWQELFEIDAIVDTPGFYAFAGRKRTTGIPR